MILLYLMMKLSWIREIFDFDYVYMSMLKDLAAVFLTLIMNTREFKSSTLNCVCRYVDWFYSIT